MVFTHLLLFSHSVMSKSLPPHGLQHTRLLCPSLSPWVCSNSSLLSQRCYPTIWSSVDPFPSCPGYFQWVGSSHQYWQFSISLSNEYSGLVSFRMDWFDLLVVQGTFKSLFQHHSSKASVLQCSAFFMVLLSCPYMTTGKTITLTTIWLFVSKDTWLALFNFST